MAIQTESTLTDRYQTTIPDAVRKALHLNKRDKIIYTVQPNGDVTLSKMDTQNDPIIDNFLDFIANDIRQHPRHLNSLNLSLFARIESLVAGVEFDLNEPLDEDLEEQKSQINSSSSNL